MLIIACSCRNSHCEHINEQTTIYVLLAHVHTETYEKTDQCIVLNIHQTCSCCTLSTEPCQDETNMKCNYNSNYDTNSSCVSTTLNCVTNTFCEAEINTVSRGCQFINIGANESQPISCCLCSKANTTDPVNLIWECSIIATPSLSPLSSGEQKSHR